MSEILLALGLSLPIGALSYGVLSRLNGQSEPRQESLWTLGLFSVILPLILMISLPPLMAHLPHPGPVLMAFDAVEPFVLNPDAVQEAARPTKAFSWAFWGISLWIIGGVIRLGLEVRREMRLIALLRAAQPAPQDLQDLLGTVSARLGLTQVIDLSVMEGRLSPFTCGLGRAKIIIARAVYESVSSDQLALILAHELSHIRRHDWIKTLVSRLIGCALWFNPFWFALERQRRLAVEQACDRQALRLFSDQAEVRRYARTLLDVVRVGSGITPAMGFGVDNKKALTMRLTALLKPTPNRIGLMAATSVFLAGVITPLALAQISYIYLAASGPVAFTASPLVGETSSRFGPRDLPQLDVPRFHRGHDIKAAEGTAIIAPAPGRVIKTEAHERYGNLLVLDHGEGWQTVYAHMQGFAVHEGDSVHVGDVIGYVGTTGLSTGPHLHVEVYHNGEALDPAEHLPGLAR